MGVFYVPETIEIGYAPKGAVVVDFEKSNSFRPLDAREQRPNHPLVDSRSTAPLRAAGIARPNQDRSDVRVRGCPRPR
jgi:hypothetical protein